jgi:ATP-dependent Lhr-like helicase
VASGELLWTGAGPRRISLLPRQLDLRQLVGGQAGELSPGVATVEAALASRGASFLQETVGASGLPLAEVQRALWQLVWAGRATNDHLEALRRGLLTSFEPPELTSAVNPLTGRASSFGRPRRGRRWQRELPTAWSGRWSLLPPAPALGPDAARELVWLLVRRYGLVARELLGPGPAWSELYPVLREMELVGELGRGVFVRGLAAAQFAPAETVDRLRALRDSDRSPGQQPGGRGPLLLSACDPALIASAVGAGLPAGATLVRRPSTYVVLDQGRVVLVAESAGRSIYLDEGTGALVREPLAALLGLLRRGLRGVRIERVNGGPVLSSFARGPLEELGFRADGPALEKRRYS